MDRDAWPELFPPNQVVDLARENTAFNMTFTWLGTLWEGRIAQLSVMKDNRARKQQVLPSPWKAHQKGKPPLSPKTKWQQTLTLAIEDAGVSYEFSLHSVNSLVQRLQCGRVWKKILVASKEYGQTGWILLLNFSRDDTLGPDRRAREKIHEYACGLPAPF